MTTHPVIHHAGRDLGGSLSAGLPSFLPVELSTALARLLDVLRDFMQMLDEQMPVLLARVERLIDRPTLH
jgi:hypothetical protein